MLDRPLLFRSAQVEALFNHYDRDHSGLLTIKESSAVKTFWLSTCLFRGSPLFEVVYRM